MISQYVQQLLEAEEKAKELVHNAGEHWVAKMKEAQESAQQMCERFRQSEHEALQQRIKDYDSQQASTGEIEAQERRIVAAINNAYREHREDAVQFCFKSALSVKLEYDTRFVKQMRLESS